jgi:hypothetical protein
MPFYEICPTISPTRHAQLVSGPEKLDSLELANAEALRCLARFTLKAQRLGASELLHFFFRLALLPRLCRALIVVASGEL